MLLKKISKIKLPVNILNNDNVELSWDGRRLGVSESMKGRRFMIVFSIQNTIRSMLVYCRLGALVSLYCQPEVGNS